MLSAGSRCGAVGQVHPLVLGIVGANSGVLFWQAVRARCT